MVDEEEEEEKEERRRRSSGGEGNEMIPFPPPPLTAQIVSGHSELSTRDYCFPFEVFPMFSSRRRDGNHLESLSSLPTDV